MDVLQLGKVNWAKQYDLPDDLDWEFNDFPPKKEHYYDVVLVTDENQLTDDDWLKLQWLVDPYHVLYLPNNLNKLSKAALHFLKCQAATKITEDPQTVISSLIHRYYFGQSGIRYTSGSFLPLMDRLQSYEMLDSGHAKMDVDIHGQWLNIGAYQWNVMVDQNMIMKIWLAYQAKGLQVRLRGFVQPFDGFGDPNSSFVLDVMSAKELVLPVEVNNSRRVVNFSLEVKGKGTIILGNLHSRWGRDGLGEFFTGGHRIMDPKTRDDIAYYFNPGDLKPPLNVYFSGARSLEGFEAYPTFRGTKAPALLFTDMRLEIGQFYTGQYFEDEIKKVIHHYLKQLGFDRSDLIMSGISMGTYPAIKLGAELGAYSISVAKPLAGLGLIAKRGRLERPYAFETIYDVDNQSVRRLDDQNLTLLDERFWQNFNKCDLSRTRLFIGYMEDDEYDNQAIHHFRNSPAVAKAAQFTSRGFAGHHNDDHAVIDWMFSRLYQMLVRDFGRKG